MKLNSLACAVSALLAAAGCTESDVTDPEVTTIRVEDGDEVVAEIQPSGLADTTIMEEVPITASVVVVFNEPINMASTTDRIRLSDTSGGDYPIVIKQRLTELTVTPEGMFDPETNHVLEIDKDIEDTSGEKTDRSVKVNFFTAAM